MSTLPRVEKDQQGPTNETSTFPTSDRRQSVASSSKMTEQNTPAEKPGQDMTYILQGKKLAVVFVAMLLSLLLVALE